MRRTSRKQGAAMIVVIITLVLFTMMSFSLILASSTLSSAANRKWVQLRMEQQAIGLGQAFAKSITTNQVTSLKTAMNNFLVNGSYVSYDLMSNEADKERALHPFPLTESNPTNVSATYGKATIRLKKVYQNPEWLLSDTQYTFLPTDKTGLNQFLDNITDEDYQLTVHITVVSPDDEQAVGTAEVTFLRTVEYEASYYKNSIGPAYRIYPNLLWEFFTDPSLTSGLVVFQESDRILAFCPESSDPIFKYQVAEVRHETE